MHSLDKASGRMVVEGHPGQINIFQTSATTLIFCIDSITGQEICISPQSFPEHVSLRHFSPNVSEKEASCLKGKYSETVVSAKMLSHYGKMARTVLPLNLILK